MDWNDTVVNEGKDTFSAWPIIFDQKDPAGLTFTKNSELQPPFEDLFIIFTFYLTTDKIHNQKVDIQIASVLSSRVSSKGLWVRGSFIQFSDNVPFSKVVLKLKAAIRAGCIGLSYVTLKDRVDIAEDGLVRKLPIIAFNFYEKEPINVASEITHART